MTHAYAAGLFDGEGWFHINRSKRDDCRRGYSFQITAALALRHRSVIDALKREFGGSTRVTIPANTRHSPSWRWHVSGERAAAFALAVRHHLLIKHRQADLAVRFQALKRLNKNRPNTDARHAELESMYMRMKRLNRRGPESEGRRG